ncbi:MAG: hypothetical protein KDD09_23070 [Phaeodactylibacter sp.]|nr:hypothetical protein [Phaeodactylibacter sp.]
MATQRLKKSSALAFFLFCSSLFIAWGQGMDLSEVRVRLSNPQFDLESHEYTLDVELQSEEAGQQLFGINVRFFYDASQLHFLGLNGLAEGYKVLGKMPRGHIGSPSSGYYLFNMKEAAGYVNGAVQLEMETTNLVISQNGWTKYFQVVFEVSREALDAAEIFYPSVILDSKGAGVGGFFKGEDGVVITLVENDPETPMESKPSLTSVQYFNWYSQGQQELPYGIPVQETGVDLGGGVVSNNVVTKSGGGVQLFQNYPNPFTEETAIGFILPLPTRAVLRFYDVTGRELTAIEGQYAAGYNQASIRKSSLLRESEVIMYRLETPDYTSGFMKMTLITE